PPATDRHAACLRARAGAPRVPTLARRAGVARSRSPRLRAAGRGFGRPGALDRALAGATRVGIGAEPRRRDGAGPGADRRHAWHRARARLPVQLALPGAALPG